MLLYFLQGSLPWCKTPEESILEMKRTISTSDLCEGLPKEFAAYFDYIHSLDYNDKPKYSYLRKLFRSLLIRQGFDHDYVFDWTILIYLKTVQSRKELQAADAAPERAPQDNSGDQ